MENMVSNMAFRKIFFFFSNYFLVQGTQEMAFLQGPFSISYVLWHQSPAISTLCPTLSNVPENPDTVLHMKKKRR